MKIHWVALDVTNAGYAAIKKLDSGRRIVETDEKSSEQLSMVKQAEMKITTRGTGHINFEALEGMNDAMSVS